MNNKQYSIVSTRSDSPTQWHWLAVALLLCSVVFQDKGYSSTSDTSVSHVSSLVADLDEEVSDTYDFDDFTFDGQHSNTAKVNDATPIGAVAEAVEPLRHDSQARAPPA